MATSGFGDEDADVASFGSDSPPRPARSLLILVAAASLAVGFLLGGRNDSLAGSQGTAPANGSPVVAGMVAKVHGLSGPPQFRLAVFNNSDDEVEVEVVSLGGTTLPVNASPAEPLRPGRWGWVGFEAPTGCQRPTAPGVTKLRVRSSTRTLEAAVALPDGATQPIEEYREAVCPADPVGLRSRQLAGVWLVEEVYGRWTSLEGKYVMRFRPDGTFLADVQGQLFAAEWGWLDQAVWGTYRLDRRLVSITVGGGSQCQRGDTVSWLATIGSDGSLALAFRRSNGPADGAAGCFRQPGEVWIARRVFVDPVLPAQPG